MGRKLPTVYPNLAAEMARDNVSCDDIADVTGKSSKCVGNWLSGSPGEFPISAAIAVQAKWWPHVPLNELFMRVEPKSAQMATEVAA